MEGHQRWKEGRCYSGDDRHKMVEETKTRRGRQRPAEHHHAHRTMRQMMLSHATKRTASPAKSGPKGSAPVAGKPEK